MASLAAHAPSPWVSPLRPGPAKTRASPITGQWESHPLSRTPFTGTPGPGRMALLPLRDTTHIGQLQTRPRPRPETASSFCLQPPEAQHYDTTHFCAQTQRVGRPQTASLRIPTRDSETVVLRGITHSHSTNSHGPFALLRSAEGTKRTRHRPCL